MRLLIALFFLMLMQMNATFAQNFQFRYTTPTAPIRNANNQPLPNAWAGGMWSPQFNEYDLNADGTEDLVVFDRADYSITTYLKIITSGIATYRYAPEYQSMFPPVADYLILKDYDNDGKKDLFTSGNIAPRVYKNTTTTPGIPHFTLSKSLLFVSLGTGIPLTNLYVPNGDIPALVDIDNDNDLDILAFESNGVTVTLNKNRSQELYGHADSLVFLVQDRCWGRFAEGNITNQVTLGLSPNCTSLRPNDNPTNSPEDVLHAGSVVMATDFDHNNKTDLLLGDISFNNLVYVQNQNAPGDVMVNIDNDFPSYTTPVNIPLYPYASFIDYDNDNKKDMVVATADLQFSNRTDEFWAYKNIGTPQKDSFMYIKNTFLVDEMIDKGYTSAPIMIDVNADGNKDLLLCTHTAARKAIIRLYLASSTLPTYYTATDTNYLNLPTYNITNAIPTTADLDANGKTDLIIGTGAGKIMYFKDISTATQPADFVLVSDNFEAISTGYNAAPELFDYNQDGKLDLIVGKRSGYIDYYPNTGTTTQPAFGNVPLTTNFGKINVREPNYFSGFSVPRFADLNNNGNADMVVGSQGSTLYFYPDVMGKLPIDSFFQSKNNVFINVNGTTIDPIFGRFSTPTIAYTNADALPDILLGTHRGGVVALGNFNNNVSTTETRPQPAINMQLVPNPNKNGIFTLFFNDYNTQANDQFFVYNAQGQLIAKQPLPQNTQSIALELGLPQGFYTIKMVGKNKVATAKMVVQ